MSTKQTKKLKPPICKGYYKGGKHALNPCEAYSLPSSNNPEYCGKHQTLALRPIDGQVINQYKHNINKLNTAILAAFFTIVDIVSPSCDVSKNNDVAIISAIHHYNTDLRNTLKRTCTQPANPID